MNRLADQGDGTWRLVDERHKKICEFKIGDKVKGEANPHSWIDDLTTEFKGKVVGVVHMENGVGLLITYKLLLFPREIPDECIDINDIEKMEVVSNENHNGR